MPTTTDIPTVRTSTTTPAASGSRGRTALVAVGAAVAGAAILAGLAFGLGNFGSTDGTPSPVPATPAAPAASGSSTHHHVNPPATPSAAVETLQRELGQLNYYEGPVNGFMTPQTVQAITYLQRDAHLPQTGTMNAATQAALAHFLATGNNQMGAN